MPLELVNRLLSFDRLYREIVKVENCVGVRVRPKWVGELACQVLGVCHCAEHDGLNVQAHVPEKDLKEVKRLIHGCNKGEPVRTLTLPDSAVERSREIDVDLKGFRFLADDEQLRPPRLTRIGLVQNAIVLPTDASMNDQRKRIHDRIGEIAQVAGSCGVNILCLQEAFHMPFAFCTREKEWCELAETIVEGPSVKLCQRLASAYGMVIVCPILERDSVHCDILWNTAVVIDETGKVMGYHRKVWCVLYGAIYAGCLYVCQCLHTMHLDATKCWRFRATTSWSIAMHHNAVDQCFLCCRIIFQESVISMKVHIIWRARLGILYLKQALAKLQSTFAMEDIIR